MFYRGVSVGYKLR